MTTIELGWGLDSRSDRTLVLVLRLFRPLWLDRDAGFQESRVCPHRKEGEQDDPYGYPPGERFECAVGAALVFDEVIHAHEQAHDHGNEKKDYDEFWQH